MSTMLTTNPDRSLLTRRELEVASLAALRLTDREIAGELYLSVRTVESHLARTYRKLGVSSRRQLAAAMGAAPRWPFSA